MIDRLLRLPPWAFATVIELGTLALVLAIIAVTYTAAITIGGQP